MKRDMIALTLVITVLLTGAVMVPSQSARAKTITVEDARGNTITFEQPPERIVSFMPSNTEILFHLGLGDRVVGVDDFSDYPPEAKNLPKVGNAFSVDYEKIANLSADVVVVPAQNSEMINKLKQYNQTVVATGSISVEDVYSDMKMLGKMCGMEEEAEQKAQDLKDEMQQITQGREDIPMKDRPDVLYLTSVDPSMYAPGEKTFQHELITKAGGDNIASNKTGWSTISESRIIDSDPDVIIAPESIRKNVENLTEKESWQGIDAVKDDDIHYVNSDVMSRPGPRIVQAETTLVNITSQAEPGSGSQNEDVPGLGFGSAIAASLATAAIYRKKQKT